MKTEEYLKSLIKSRFGSINNFSKVVRIPQSTLATALSRDNGFNSMSVGSAIKICDALDIDLETLDDIIKAEDINEGKVLDIYRSVSKPAKNLILNVCKSIYEYEIKTNKETSKKFLIAASGGENASREEIEEAIELAKKL